MSSPTTVHPHLPRFSQAITGVLCVEATVFQDVWVLGVALALVVVSRFAPRWSPVNWLFRQMFARPTETREPVAPVRFSQTLAIIFLTVSIAAHLAGLALFGWIMAIGVATVALISAITGLCIGCEVYRLFMLRRGADGDLRELLGLRGAGPWTVVLSAPGCARCEPVARELESLSEAEITRIDITETPAAARLPVSSVPAVVIVGADGHLEDIAVGRLDRPQLEAVLAVAATA